MAVGSIARLWTRVTGSIIGFGIGAAASSVFEAPLADLSAEAWSKFTNRRLSPADLAELVLRGERTEAEGAGEAKESGINADRFGELVKLVGNPPGVETLVTMRRRGIISDADFARGIVTGRIRTEWIDQLAQLQHDFITPAEAAGLVARGFLDRSSGEKAAAAAGISSSDFGHLVDDALNVPPLGELLELVNRGAIPQDAASSALRRAGVRGEFIDPLLTLGRHLPSVPDLVRFAVREVYTPEARSRFGLDQDFPQRFADEAAKQGLEQEDAGSYWAAHWNLPSPEQGFAMLHRGIIGQADLELLLKTLDVMPFWRDKLIQLNHIIPGRIDLRRMYQHGVIDRARLKAGYLELGYEDADAELLTTFAEKEKLTNERDLSKTEVVALYEARTIPHDEAATLLGHLGYSTTDIDLILRLADYRREKSYRAAAVSIVRQRFLDRELDEATATARLDKVGVPPDEREQLLDLWTFAREENPHRLTEPQAAKAWLKGLKDEQWYRGYLELLGYPKDEADVLVSLHTPAG